MINSDKAESAVIWPTVVGYAERLSVRAGERIGFMISADAPKQCDLHLVRLLHGAVSEASGFASEEIEHSVNGPHHLGPQRTYPGSYMRAEVEQTLAPDNTFNFEVLLYPTIPIGPSEQTVMSWWGDKGGAKLALNSCGKVVLTLRDGENSLDVTSDLPLEAHRWYRISASFSGESGEMELVCAPLSERYTGRAGRVARVAEACVSRSKATLSLGFSETPVTFAAGLDQSGNPSNHYNGKIERPRFLLPEGPSGERKTLLGWDFSDGIGPNGVSSLIAASHGEIRAEGRLFNTPARCASGSLWSPDAPDFRAKPEVYAAIHFHDDDVTDVGWEQSIEILVPPDLSSDVYALRVADGEFIEHIPFFVRPASGAAKADALFLVPTASYLAYSNEHAAHDAHDAQQIVSRIPVIEAADLYLHVHREFGESSYSQHNDGSGVSYCSYRRPILNMRPTHRYHAGAWQFPADLAILDWLKKSDIAFDIVTDHDLHEEGIDLLDGYKVLLTGTHPEYYSREMLDAVEDYVAGTGTLMYLGGNGFYWEVSFDPEQPFVMEIRRGDYGNRAWQAAPGELRHATTGRPGGIWRAQGRPPQRLVGVGYAGQGFDKSSYYVQLIDSAHPDAAFIFDGIDRDERIGDFGDIGDGAAGQELDRYDIELGSPADAMVLATTEGLNRGFVRVSEEILFNRPGYGADFDYKVRGDIVYFRTNGGGAVFSVGSISWPASLSHNGYDNNVARMTKNVIDAFIGGLPELEELGHG